MRRRTWCRLAVVTGVLGCMITGCSSGLVGGSPTVAPFDPREPFGAFAHPVQPWDRVPDKLTIELDVTDARKVGSWPGTDVFIALSASGTICLIADARPPWGNTGGSVCAPASEAAAKGIGMMYETDPGKALGLILVPDAATATIDRGTFIASGNGVIGIGTEKPKEGIAATISFPDGHSAHLELQIQ